MSGDTQLVLWIAGVHLLGLMAVAVLLLPALRDAPVAPSDRSDSDGDDGWGRGPTPPPDSPAPPGGGIPLTDAEPARVRFREPGRLADRLPSRPRRPVHDPAPARPAQPVGLAGVPADHRSELTSRSPEPTAGPGRPPVRGHHRAGQ